VAAQRLVHEPILVEGDRQVDLQEQVVVVITRGARQPQLPAFRIGLGTRLRLDRHRRPFELHVYEKGRHGIGLGFRPYDGFTSERLHPWTVECRRWLVERGFTGD
jgi:hypothetical protein